MSIDSLRTYGMLDGEQLESLWREIDHLRSSQNRRISKNPNNCETCDYLKMNTNKDGYCYMFKHEPMDVCLIHTGRSLSKIERMARIEGFMP